MGTSPSKSEFGEGEHCANARRRPSQRHSYPLAGDILMAVFQGYFDDSNKSGDPRVNCVGFAGFIAPVDSWKTFEPAWKSVLDRFEITHFHMADLKPCTGPFSDKEKWKDAARETELLSALVGVIKDSNLQAFSACPPV
jgi:hypothetical protein